MNIETRKTLGAIIRDGRRIKEFLEDDSVKEVFAGLELALFTQWLAATDSTVREALHAEARAVEDLQTSLRVLVGTGEHEEAAIAARDKAKHFNPEDRKALG